LTRLPQSQLLLPPEEPSDQTAPLARLLALNFDLTWFVVSLQVDLPSQQRLFVALVPGFSR
jgi:hypothetical protein